MGDLFERIRSAVREERYLFSDHADNMPREGSIVHWQVVDGLERGRLLVERPTARPNPVIEVEQVLADAHQGRLGVCAGTRPGQARDRTLLRRVMD